LRPYELLALGGPTASGKSQLACLLAERVGGEVVSVDSMAVYRYMDVGTAKPKDCPIKHHLVDVAEPGDYFDAKLFEELAQKAIREIKSKGKLPILCGGTYLYFQALLYGLAPTPEPDWALRKRLYDIVDKKGSEFLHRKLRAIDPIYAQKVHPRDARRIVRALEVFLQTGKPFSSFHGWQDARYKFLGFYITRPWESLSKRIEERVEKMFQEGLVQEVEKLMNMGFEGFLTSAQAIGYKELVPYLKGEVSLEDAKAQVIKNTKEYAKRQIRWFRRQGWVEIDLDRLSLESAVELILSKLFAGDEPEQVVENYKQGQGYY
jgi:tRNA dimethylallyltransferase